MTYVFYCVTDVPIYILTYGAIGILVPIVQVFWMIFFANGVLRKDPKILEWTRQLKGIEWFPLYYCLPIESIDDLVVTETVSSKSSEADAMLSNGGRLSPGPSARSDSPGSEAASIVVRKSCRRHFYIARYNALYCVLMLTLLLTFGIAYPLLAFMLTINIFLCTTAFQLTIHFHAQQVASLSQECKDAWQMILTHEIKDMQKILLGSRTGVYLFSSLFACLAVYDTTATNSTTTALILVSFLLFCTTITNRILKYTSTTKNADKTMAKATVSVQLRNTNQAVEMCVVAPNFKTNKLIQSNNDQNNHEESVNSDNPILWHSPPKEK